MIIQRKAPRQGNLKSWTEDGEILIRESLDRGKDVQTVCLTPEELERILKAHREQCTLEKLRTLPQFTKR